jgi:hypothetical protein
VKKGKKRANDSNTIIRDSNTTPKVNGNKGKGNRAKDVDYSEIGKVWGCWCYPVHKYKKNALKTL